jgi:hypothetical protein
MLTQTPPGATGRHTADDVLAAALAGGATYAEAATLANVSERTVVRRMAEPDFRRKVAEARSAVVERTIGLLTDASTEAAATLRRLLGARSEHVAYLASAKVIELVHQLRTTADLEARIAELEKELAQ